jgi:hypothetical protein
MLQNIARWKPRLRAIREWLDEHEYWKDADDGFGVAVIELEEQGKLESLHRGSFSAGVIEFAEALNSATDAIGGPGRNDTDKFKRIAERMRPLLERHSEEVFEMFLKCVLLGFDDDTVFAVFAELRVAQRKVGREEVEAA